MVGTVTVTAVASTVVGLAVVGIVGLAVVGAAIVDVHTAETKNSNNYGGTVNVHAAWMRPYRRVLSSWKAALV